MTNAGWIKTRWVLSDTTLKRVSHTFLSLKWSYSEQTRRYRANTLAHNMTERYYLKLASTNQIGTSAIISQRSTHPPLLAAVSIPTRKQTAP